MEKQSAFSPSPKVMYGHWLLIEAKGFLTVCENRNKSQQIITNRTKR